MPSKKEDLEFKNIKFDNKGGAILGILEGPVADYINPTRNDRHYGDKLWENVLTNPLVVEQFANGGIPGELDHPADRDDICTEKVAVLMSEPPVKDPKTGQYIGKFNILDTPCGRIVYTMAKAGFKFGVSSRGTGDTYETYDGKEEVDPDSYEFTCFDVVLLPSVKTARMNMITEAFKPKFNYKKALREQLESLDTEESKQLFKETLQHIGVNLEEGSDAMEKNNLNESFNNQEFAEFMDLSNKLGLKTGADLEKFAKDHGDVKDKDLLDAMRKEAEATKENLNEGADDKKDDETVDNQPSVDTEEVIEIDETDSDNKEDEIQENEVINDRIKDLFNDFLKQAELEVEAEDKEQNEEEFIQLVLTHFPELKDLPVEEDKVEVEEENSDINAVEDPKAEDEEGILESLQKALVENVDLKKQIKSLNEQLAVSDTKAKALNEDLNKFKGIAAQAGKASIKSKDIATENISLNNEIKKLKESLTTKDQKIESLNKSVSSAVSKGMEKIKENKELKEALDKANQSITKMNESLTKSKTLTEKYKKLAHNVADSYIEAKANMIGVSVNEVRNRLTESYTLTDVDRVCNELKDYSIRVKTLPFAVDKPGVRAKLREDNSRNPIQLDSNYDDEVDDFLLDLAGLKR